MDRKYSVAEIDSMRRSVDLLNFTGRTWASDKQVEDELRTYMLNGTEPAELEEAAKSHMDKRTIVLRATNAVSRI